MPKRREGTRCRSDLIPPTKLKHKGWVGWTRVLSPSSGGHSKMSPTSTLRGLGLGETPLRRWEAVTEMGRSQALIRTIATPSQRQTIDRGTTPRLTSVGYTLVTPTGVAKCALNTPHTSAICLLIWCRQQMQQTLPSQAATVTELVV